MLQERKKGDNRPAKKRARGVDESALSDEMKKNKIARITEMGFDVQQARTCVVSCCLQLLICACCSAFETVGWTQSAEECVEVILFNAGQIGQGVR